MAYLGNKSSALGPQPIANRLMPPPAMFAAAEHILDLLAQGRRAELEILALPKASGDLSNLVRAIASDAYESHQIIAHAKANDHYYVKARLFGPNLPPFTLQLRLGLQRSRWLIWEAVNLSGGRSAWTR